MTLRLPHAILFKLLAASGMMLVMVIIMLMFSDRASAHGYVESPGSRAYLCKLGQNQNCGSIVWEPQSLEAPKGFPQAGPADGKIASAAGKFPELDEQYATRWSKVPMTVGMRMFTWKFTAPHATTNWKYYITKQNWDRNAPLSRNSFDLTPFCTENYGGKRPPSSYTNTCNVPYRTGYQVILAVWEIHDTGNAFYNVIDVDFGGNLDSQVPTAPADLNAVEVTATSVSLAWNASNDNVGVTSYKIYNGSELIGTVSGSTLSYSVIGLNSNTSYTFTVRAEDAVGNISDTSQAVTVSM
ncbi:lytic polysaccharide monooxygenase [Paenibacillus elgii]|uniref:lytic polysaccharide monooxygenase n=1 Tax=Paenibacillus elgii TaxID=189691 RepID=UPI0027BA7F75|nr:lytic polysaccharide monooxygenase [Paenibacillus elgii]